MAGDFRVYSDAHGVAGGDRCLDCARHDRRGCPAEHGMTILKLIDSKRPEKVRYPGRKALKFVFCPEKWGLPGCFGDSWRQKAGGPAGLCSEQPTADEKRPRKNRGAC